jgi:hypothetical protein
VKRSATGEAETFPGRDFGFVDISFTLNGQESSCNIALEVSFDAGNVYTAILPEPLNGDLVNIIRPQCALRLGRKPANNIAIGDHGRSAQYHSAGIQLEIYNIMGERLESVELAGQDSYLFDLSANPAGIYLIRVSRITSPVRDFENKRIPILPPEMSLAYWISLIPK